MKRLVPTLALLCAALLFAFAAAEAPAASLVSFEYAVFGGMENEDFTCTLRLDDTPFAAMLTVAENGDFEAYSLPLEALDAVAELMAAYDPAGWSSLPDREEFALDAPERRIALIYDDGSEYTLYSDKDVDGPLFAEAERLFRSFLDGAFDGEAE